MSKASEVIASLEKKRSDKEERRIGQAFMAEMDDAADDLNTEVEKPAPLAAAIPDSGWIAESMEFLTHDSMVPPEFALAASLAAVAGATQGQRVFRLGTSMWGTGLWIVGLAKAGGKKSSALKGISPLRIVAGEERMPTNITSEALSEAFTEEHPNQWMAITEFASFMNETEKKTYTAGLRDALNGTWDGSEFQTGDRQRVGDRKYALPPYASLTILGMATESHFSEWTATSAIQQGFLTRVIFVPQETKVEYAGFSTADTPLRSNSHLVESLRAIRQGLLPKGRSFWNTRERPAVSPTSEAVELLNAFDRPWAEREDLPAALEGFASRLGANAFRLAFAYGMASHPERVEVQADDVRLAIAFLEYGRTRSWPLIERYHNNFSFQAKNLAMLRGTLDRLSKGEEDGWVNHRKLVRTAHAYGRQFEEILDHLIETGLWRRRVVHHPQNRKPMVQYRAADYQD